MSIKLESNIKEQQEERLQLLNRLETKDMMLSPLLGTTISRSLKRHKDAIDSGWHLWEPKDELLGIFVRSPVAKIWYVWPLVTLFTCVAAGLTVPSHDAWLRAIGITAGVLGGVFLVAYGIAAIIELMTRPGLVAFRRYDDKVQRHWRAGDWDHYSVRIWSAPIPTKIWAKWKKDRALFDACYIASEDRSGFTVVEKRRYNPPSPQPTPLHIDPYLIGRIGDDLYVGAVWDTNKEKGLQIAMQEDALHDA